MALISPLPESNVLLLAAAKWIRRADSVAGAEAGVITKRKKCSDPSCSKFAQKGEFCPTHGADTGISM